MSSHESSTLVALINGLNQVIGLPSYTTIHKVHKVFKVAVACYIITGILQIIGLFMAKDPDRLFQCFSITAFSGMGIFKLILLYYNHNSWQVILKKISKLEDEQLNNFITSDVDYQSDDEDTIDFPKFVNNYTERYISIFNLLRKVYYFTVIIFVMSPFLERLIYIIRGLEYLGYPHILPEWNPLDDLSIFGYLGTVSCEFIAAVYCVVVHTTFDLTAIGIMVFICGQCTLLDNYMINIGGKGTQCDISKKRDDRARFRIKHCHRIHLIVVNVIIDLDKLLKNMIGVYVLVATLVLCFVTLQLNSEDMTLMQLVPLFQYMCGVLIQLFLLCWYGDAVSNGSTIGMGQGPFGAAHWCLSPCLRRDLSTLGAGMMRIQRLQAGPFNFLNLPLFALIVRTAYSCYAILGKRN